MDNAEQYIDPTIIDKSISLALRVPPKADMIIYEIKDKTTSKISYRVEVDKKTWGNLSQECFCNIIYAYMKIQKEYN